MLQTQQRCYEYRRSFAKDALNAVRKYLANILGLSTEAQCGERAAVVEETLGPDLPFISLATETDANGDVVGTN